MKYFGIKELQAKNKSIQNVLKEDRYLTLTNHGKPFAIMLAVNEDDYLDHLRLVTTLQAQQAVRQIRADATKNNTITLSLEDINQEINTTRSNKRN